MNSEHEPKDESDPHDASPAEPSQPTADAYAVPASPTSAMFRVDIAAQSNMGNGGRKNEDHYLVVRIERSLGALSTNLPEGALPRSFDEVAYGMLVAAGLGGMPAGEMASGMALCKLVELAVNTPDWIMKMNRRNADVVKRRMLERFYKVDKALKQITDRDQRLLGMGTTLTVAISLGADLFLGHVGDSRAYLLRGDEFHQLTRDHTLGQALIDAGVGEAENVLVRGMRRVLTAALGTSRRVDPQVEHLQLRHGDQLLLCTDGLAESVNTDTIQSILRAVSSPDEACRELIRFADSGEDNVTVVVARYSFPQAA